MSSEKEVTLRKETRDPSNTPQNRKNYPDAEFQTLRRSTRKSIKPLQDYFEIVQMNLRSSGKRVHTTKTDEESIKWTPAKVGRVSQKRKRKNRKLNTTKKFENIHKIQKDENELKNSCNESVTIENNNSKLDEFNLTNLSIHPLQNVSEEDIENIELKCTQNARNALETLNINTIIQGSDDFKEQNKSIELDMSIKDGSKRIDQCFEINEENRNVDVLATSPGSSARDKISMEYEENIMLRLVVSDDENENDLAIPKTEISKNIIDFPKRRIPYCFSNENVNKVNLKFRHKDTKFYKINDTCKPADKGITTGKAKITTIPVTTLQPKDIVLRSIRKRSFSACTDIDEAKKHRKLLSKNKVTFNSPANQVTIIGVLDEHIIQNVHKNKNAITLPNCESYITKRNKRSMSSERTCTKESTKKDISLNSNLVKIIPASSEITKNSTQAPLIRRNMPNFSAIHQNQFKKMENLVEHVARKAERAKTLINSATKLSTASAKKITNISTNVNHIQCKPKMARKLTCNNNDLTLNDRPSTTAKATINLNKPNAKNSNNPSFQKDSMNEKKNFINDSLAYIKPLAVIEQSSNQLHTNQKSSNLDKKVLHISTKKNLPLNNNISSELREKLISDLPISSHEHLKNNKFSERRQRHMEMFKERKTTKSQKQCEYLRGVRSNRRFELQMLHRQNLSLNK